MLKPQVFLLSVLALQIIHIYGVHFKDNFEQPVLTQTNPVGDAQLRHDWSVTIPLLQKDGQYIGSVSVGTPAQYFTVLFDTGSVYTWVPCVHCMSLSCSHHKRFNEGLSTTFNALSGHNDGPLIDLEFGSGSLSFTEGKDVLCLHPDFCLKNQTLGFVSEQRDNVFNEMPFDGIVGLSLSGLATRESESVLTSIKTTINQSLRNKEAKRRLRQHSPLFIIYHLEIQPNSFRDTIQFTTTLSSQSSLHPHWFENLSNSYWTISMLDIIVDDIPLGVCMSRPKRICQAVIDTGTSDIIGHESDVKLLRNLAGFNQHCLNWSALRPITFQFKGVDGPLNIVKTPLQIFGKLDISSNESINNNLPDCRNGIISGSMFNQEYTTMDEDNTHHQETLMIDWILGNVFFRGLDILFDIGTVASRSYNHDLILFECASCMFVTDTQRVGISL